MLNLLHTPIAIVIAALSLMGHSSLSVSTTAQPITTVKQQRDLTSHSQQFFHPPNESFAQIPNSTISTGSRKTLADGVYLFGETSEPEQIGQGYVVFEVRQGILIGAVYMPSSSFDCVYGTAQPQRLDVTIVSSYEQTAYPYSIPLQQMHPIMDVSANDRRILSTCTNTYQEQVWNQKNTVGQENLN